jgi:hypothetical protein
VVYYDQSGMVPGAITGEERQVFQSAFVGGHDPAEAAYSGKEGTIEVSEPIRTVALRISPAPSRPLA